MTITAEVDIAENEHLTKVQSWFKFSAVGCLLVFIAGALLPLAFAPINLYFIATLSPAILFYALLFVSPRRAAWLGWWFGMGFFGVGVSWVFVAIYVFGLSSLFFSVLFTFIYIAFIAVFIALQCYLSVLFIHKFKIKNNSVILLLLFPLFWVLLEWFRGWFLTGFPWLSLGYSQTESFLSGYAAVFGVFGVSWLTALSSSLLLVTLLHKCKVRILSSLLSIVIIWMAGYFLLQVSWTETKGKPIKVSLVQGNVEQKHKWDPEHFENRKQRYLSLSRQHWDSDLILWPENSLTIFHHELKDNFLSLLTAEAKIQNTDIIFGLPVLDRKNNEYFSSLSVINGRSDASSKEQFYHKNHLVPFGEYVPLAGLLRGIVAFFDLPMSGFTAGNYQQNLLNAAGQKIAPTICYEDAFGEDLIRFLPEATLLLNASNNAWYGDSFAPHQHVQISQMRALETGRDMMRVTTNGVSALINFKGEVISRSPQFKAHVVSGFVHPRTGSTPYVRWGNYAVLLIIVLGLLAMPLYEKYRKYNYKL